VIIRTVKSSTGRRRRGAAALVGAGAFAFALTLTACSGSGSGSGTSAAASAAAEGASGQVRVLASTNVWGDVVEQIGGEHVAVTSIIADPSADPHSFQSSARHQLALSKAAHDGAPVAITEAVPLYLVEAAGLDNVTPGEFTEAIENETDVPAAAMDQTLKLFSGQQVKVLVYNEQTSGPQTEQVVDAAKTNGIPAVPVTETLPDGQDYLSWMQANIQALSKALGG